MSSSRLLALSGLLWLAVGVFLLQMGLFLFKGSLASERGLSEEVILLLIAISLFLGYCKGRYLLAKRAEKTAQQLQAVDGPLSLGHLFTRGYLLLIGLMMALGAGMRFFGVPLELRGIIDVAVGAALLQGGVAYLRLSYQHRQRAAAASICDKGSL